MERDYGNCRTCGRNLALVAHHPPERQCHPCWMAERQANLSPFVRRALANELPGKAVTVR